MITRIVKLTIQTDRVADFVALFTTYQSDIARFPGCQRVELLADVEERNVFVTLSEWESAEALNAYRKSELFGKVWPATKLLFAAKPEARSFERKIN
ncbi:putative quinol monooxygenase [Reichenbachiella ulvae]|uniref:Antibiotic biosynthesis monooxygenase n=1 Tax=Reichenbachiella ulvae TaxID=2980104 RepID=A0ABT3CU04_9BACT|nr:antibiotic biosynthesis monooxygenase family protein [Reichenbachiella ulvae]MCV9386713.1 antibiotic biosynthesis monooxygenase [Reichenbachiella ulvae]